MRDMNRPSDLGQSKKSAVGVLWWAGQTVLTGTASFFVFFGFSLLKAAYGLKDPFSFIMTFFASNLIILISAVMVVGFVVRMVRSLRASPQGETDENAEE